MKAHDGLAVTLESPTSAKDRHGALVLGGPGDLIDVLQRSDRVDLSLDDQRLLGAKAAFDGEGRAADVTVLGDHVVLVVDGSCGHRRNLSQKLEMLTAPQFDVCRHLQIFRDSAHRVDARGTFRAQHGLDRVFPTQELHSLRGKVQK